MTEHQFIKIFGLIKWHTGKREKKSFSSSEFWKEKKSTLLSNEQESLHFLNLVLRNVLLLLLLFLDQIQLMTVMNLVLLELEC